MKAKLLALAVISTFALSACGGGGDDSPKVNKPVTGGNSATGGASSGGGANSGGGTSSGGTTTNNTPFTMQQQSTQWTITLDASHNVTQISETPTYPNENGDANYKKLVIDGMTLDLPDTNGNPSEEKNRRVEVKASNAYATIAPNINNRGTAYARYGLAYSDKAPAKLVAFYQGEPTPVNQVPSTGAATYLGYAIAVDAAEINKYGQGNTDYGEKYGLSKFTADFANKKLTGTLSDWQNKAKQQPKQVKIVADIQANTFKGTANNTGTAEGKFYGANAQNLAGAFNDKSQNLQGVFGANKQ